MSTKVRRALEDIDIIDRWLRELGQIDLFRYRGSPVGPLNPIDVSVAAIVLPAVDVTDRWARQLGLVDISRVLGGALTAANPIIMGLYDAAGNRMPAMDVAARAGFVDITDRVGRLLGIAGRNWLLGALDIPDLSDRAARLVGITGRNWVLGALDIPDLSNRAARLLGIIYGDVGQLAQRAATRDLLVQLRSAGVEIDPRARTWVLGAGDVPDLSDRWARQLGLIDISRVLGAPLTAANPVISGLYGVSGDRVPVFPDLSIPISPSKITIQGFESIIGPPVAVAEGAAANLAVNTDHRGSGVNSVEFDKVAGNVLAGVSYVIPALDLSNYSEHAQVDFYISVPTPAGGTIVQAYAALGTDNANLFFWAIPVADLALDAWNHVHLHMHDVSGVLGVGANLSAITYCALYIQTSVAGATFANALVDQLVVKRVFETSVMQNIPTLYDGLTPMEIVTATAFGYVYDPVAGDWNRAREGTAIGQALVDLADRWTRQLGLIDISRYLGGAVGPANPIDVRDTGINTNPRRYEKDNGFYSNVVARAGGVATALWTVATGRTAGQETTIYTLTIENSTGAAVTAWLEIGGVAITIPYHIENNDSIVIDYIAGLTSGNADVNCNASVNAVNFSIYGTEA